MTVAIYLLVIDCFAACLKVLAMTIEKTFFNGHFKYKPLYLSCEVIIFLI